MMMIKMALLFQSRGSFLGQQFYPPPFVISQFVDAAKFKWSNWDWPSVNLKGQIIYEMHIGTFTEEGT